VNSIWRKLRQEIDIWRVGALPGVAVIGAVLVLRFTGVLQFLELVALDNLLRLRPPEPPDERIVIIGIDEADIRQLKTYPIPDREIAILLKTVKTYQPTAVGLDIFRDLPIGPGHSELVKEFQTIDNLFVIEKALPERAGYTVPPPPEVPAQRVGFADAVLDTDGYLRRSLLGTATPQGAYQLSLTIRLAEAYLKQKGISLQNGRHDPTAMRFGKTELPPFQAHLGGYVGADAGGNQVLLNFRSGSTPFRVLSLRQVLSGRINPDWLRNRIVLIGVTALSVKDIVNSGAISGVNPGLVYGVEVQAHAVSQILSAVLDERPLLRTWSDAWEYLWILGWGLLGIGLGRILRSPLHILLVLGLAGVSLLGICYGLLIIGYWVPLIPALLVLVINSAGLTATLFYRYEQNLRSRLKERQIIIDQTFDAIHNGPLQTLTKLLRDTQGQNLESSQQILGDLQQLNQELRTVYASVRREALDQEDRLLLNNDRELDLMAPFHELLYEVYSSTLTRDLPCFETLKVKIVKFDPINCRYLSLEHKRGLCRFLEESLCNVGKYAADASRLTVICAEEQGRQYIRIVDNGSKINPFNVQLLEKASGLGTRQAKNLAGQLGGKFRRFANRPQGTVCELSWPIVKFWFWQF
jgi:CHASE2 domain-containing sensor protein